MISYETQYILASTSMIKFYYLTQGKRSEGTLVPECSNVEFLIMCSLDIGIYINVYVYIVGIGVI